LHTFTSIILQAPNSLSAQRFYSLVCDAPHLQQGFQQSTLNYNQIIQNTFKIAYTEGAYKPIPICTKYEAGSFNWLSNSIMREIENAGIDVYGYMPRLRSLNTLLVWLRLSFSLIPHKALIASIISGVLNAVRSKTWTSLKSAIGRFYVFILRARRFMGSEPSRITNILHFYTNASSSSLRDLMRATVKG